MLCAVLFCAFTAAAATWFSLRQPWLGLDLAANVESGGLYVTAVEKNGPSAGLPLHAQLVAINAVNGGETHILLTADDIVEEPDFFETYERITAFFQRQTLLWNVLRQGPVRLEIVDQHGDRAELQVAPQNRPLSDLPLIYWVQIFVGISTTLIGAWVWSLRLDDWSAGMFALAGFWVLVSAFPAAIYSGRELALHGESFQMLSAINHLGANAFGAAMIALFLFYPRRIVRPKWLLPLPLIVLFWWMADTSHVLLLPQISGQVSMIVELLLIVVAIVVQWRINRHDVRNLAVLRWLGLSVIIGAGAFIAIVTAPMVLGESPTFGQGYFFLFFLLIYIGIALGLRRYRLFELDEWAFRILFYTAGLVVLFIFDAALIYALSLGRELSFGLSLLVVGFVYLPLRDILWRRAVSRPKMREDELFRDVIGVAFTASAQERTTRWRDLLTKLFDPLEMTILSENLSEATLRQDGLELALPPAAGAPALLLRHPWRGNGLFNPTYLQLARHLTSLMQHAEENRDAFERGAAGERRRIAQDLHDDVGARLLSGLHKPDLAQTRETMRESLADMRSIVSGLSGERLPLDQVAGDLRHETAQRFEVAGISLDWPLTDDFQDKILLDYQVYRNLRSTLREIVSNIIRHADAAHVSIAMFLHGETLHVSVNDNGRGLDSSAPQNGNGLSNMQSRISSLGGSCSFPVVERGTRIEISLPLPGVLTTANSL